MRAKPKIFKNNETGECYAQGKCVFTFEEYTTAKFPFSAVEAYQNGAYLQDAFHMLNSADREFIMSGISPKGWEKNFPAEEVEIF